MNFLAHLYLSNNNTDLMLGNFFADAVRGNKFNEFPAEIAKGIILHRNIDTFTDQHPVVRASKRRLHERYGHYDGVIIDMFYDHFLAINWLYYSIIPLDIFAKSFYDLLHKNHVILPEKTKQMLPYLERYNWLYNYQFFDGMEQVLNGMNRRTKGISQMNMAIIDLKEHYTDFNNDFKIFFEELMQFTIQRIKEL